MVVLDLGLPDMDGVEVISGLRGWTRVPIIVLSARHDLRREGRGAGRGRRRLRDQAVRHGRTAGPAARRGPPGRAAPARTTRRCWCETDGFTVDLAAKKVHRDGADVRLTPTEWHLLEVLVRNTGRLVSQKQLLQEVWGPAYGTETNYLRVYMAQLRRKLEADPSHPRHFVTEPGMGYRFESVIASGAAVSRGAARYASGMSGATRSDRPAGRFRRMLDRLSSSQEDLQSEELRQDTAERRAAPGSQDCQDRQIVTVTGTLRTVTLRPRAGVPALEAELFDGSAPLDVVWLGRRSIVGIEPGRRIIASGRISMNRGRRCCSTPSTNCVRVGQE